MQNPSILVVDDNFANQKLLKVLLLSEGFRVRTASTVSEGLALLEQEASSLVLTDLQLPDMDGLELARCLKMDARWARIPVVAVTAFAHGGDRELALEAGCAAFLSKPINTRSLPHLLRSLLENGGKPAL